MKARGQFIQQHRRQPGNGKIDGKIFQPHRLQRGDGGEYDFGIGRRQVRADQLDSRLGKLALGLHLGAAYQQHRPAIGKSQRARRVRQPAGRQPGDLRRGIGAQSHHPLAFRIHQPEGLLRRRGARPGEQGVLEFQQGWCHPLIPVRGEAIHDHLGGAGLPFGLGRQNIREAGRQQGRMGVRRLVHGHQVDAGGAITPPGERANCQAADVWVKQTHTT